MKSKLLYVGQTRHCVTHRFEEHVRAARIDSNNHAHLHLLMRRHGLDSFGTFILEENPLLAVFYGLTPSFHTTSHDIHNTLDKAIAQACEVLLSSASQELLSPLQQYTTLLQAKSTVGCVSPEESLRKFRQVMADFTQSLGTTLPSLAQKLALYLSPHTPLSIVLAPLSTKVAEVYEQARKAVLPLAQQCEDESVGSSGNKSLTAKEGRDGTSSVPQVETVMKQFNALSVVRDFGALRSQEHGPGQNPALSRSGSIPSVETEVVQTAGHTKKKTVLEEKVKTEARVSTSQDSSSSLTAVALE